MIASSPVAFPTSLQFPPQELQLLIYKVTDDLPQLAHHRQIRDPPGPLACPFPWLCFARLSGSLSE